MSSMQLTEGRGMSKIKISVGAVITEPGSTEREKRGSWRTLKPIVDKEKCNGASVCWMFCPDNAITIVNGKAVVDYDYCKGCGICAAVCPVRAIRMAKEEK